VSHDPERSIKIIADWILGQRLVARQPVGCGRFISTCFCG
jgi:hypothetical protein